MKDQLKICILGDICPDWGFRSSFDKQDEALIFNDALVPLQNADITIGNLEAPASERGTPIRKSGPCLHCKTQDIDVLKNAGLDVLSLANNHILDYGPDALLDTMGAAEANGILTVGAGRNLAEASLPLILERAGQHIGIMSFAEQEFNIAGQDAPGANLFDPYSSLKDISNAKAECDYLIILYHGGIEEYPLPSPLLQKKCRAMADAGADLILCQHSHCIGTRENYHGTEILYGQGNAIFGKRGRSAWDTGLLTEVVLYEDGNRVSYRAFSAEEEGISFLQEAENRAVLVKMEELSQRLDDMEFIKKSWDAFCAEIAPMDMPMLLCWNRVLNKLNRIMKNRLIKWFVNHRKAMIAMNLVRCDSHHEVIQTILENMQK